eukprot:3267669-Prymnesium_polylepis.2
MGSVMAHGERRASRAPQGLPDLCGAGGVRVLASRCSRPRSLLLAPRSEAVDGGAGRADAQNCVKMPSGLACRCQSDSVGVAAGRLLLVGGHGHERRHRHEGSAYNSFVRPAIFHRGTWEVSDGSWYGAARGATHAADHRPCARAFPTPDDRDGA